MEDSTNGFNAKVHMACVRMLYELNIIDNLGMQYAFQYASYVMSWCMHMPIHTIVIGQNPYPNDIYPEIGSALSYSPSATNGPTMSVKNIAHDINNYDGTEMNDSIQCFMNSWHLIERGSIFINETVLDSLYDSKSNTRGLKEMESQLRAIQILISESYFMGRTEFVCIGMGMRAEQMLSMIRGWNPKDLFNVRTISCKNPAARDLGDMPSHEITLGKNTVSKVLSNLVREYVKMGPPKMSAADKRKNDSIKALEEASENVGATGNVYAQELSNFSERLRGIREGGNEKISVEELESMTSNMAIAVRKSMDAIRSHTVSMVLCMRSISSDNNKDTNSASSQVGTPVSTVVIPEPVQSTTRRRRRRIISNEMTPVDETPENTIAVSNVESSEIAPTLEDPPTYVPTTSRRRRRVVLDIDTSSVTEHDNVTNADTEYTAAISVRSDKDFKMTPAESVNVKCFANWCESNIKDDSTMYEIINSAADSMTIANDLVRSVVQYVRERKDQDLQWDPYEELNTPGSLAYKWSQQNMVYSK